MEHLDFFEMIDEDYAQNDLKCRIKRSKRRSRSPSFTTFQKETLEETFQNCPFLTRNGSRRLEFCQFLGLTEKQVSDWFRKRRARERTCYTDQEFKKFCYRFEPEVVAQLEEEYLKNYYPNRSSKTEIAKRLGLTFNQVQKWFLNRRRKQKKLEKIIDNAEQLEEEYNRYNNPDEAQLEDVAFRLDLSVQETKFSNRRITSNQKKVLEFDDETLVKYIANIKPEEVDDLIEKLEEHLNQMNSFFDL